MNADSQHVAALHDDEGHIKSIDQLQDLQQSECCVVTSPHENIVIQTHINSHNNPDLTTPTLSSSVTAYFQDPSIERQYLDSSGSTTQSLSCAAKDSSHPTMQRALSTESVSSSNRSQLDVKAGASSSNLSIDSSLHSDCAKSSFSSSIHLSSSTISQVSPESPLQEITPVSESTTSRMKIMLLDQDASSQLQQDGAHHEAINQQTNAMMHEYVLQINEARARAAAAEAKLQEQSMQSIKVEMMLNKMAEMQESLERYHNMFELQRKQSSEIPKLSNDNTYIETNKKLLPDINQRNSFLSSSQVERAQTPSIRNHSSAPTSNHSSAPTPSSTNSTSQQSSANVPQHCNVTENIHDNSSNSDIHASFVDSNSRLDENAADSDVTAISSSNEHVLHSPQGKIQAPATDKLLYHKQQQLIQHQQTQILRLTHELKHQRQMNAEQIERSDMQLNSLLDKNLILTRYASEADDIRFKYDQMANLQILTYQKLVNINEKRKVAEARYAQSQKELKLLCRTANSLLTRLTAHHISVQIDLESMTIMSGKSLETIADAPQMPSEFNAHGIFSASPAHSPPHIQSMRKQSQKSLAEIKTPRKEIDSTSESIEVSSNTVASATAVATSNSNNLAPSSLSNNSNDPPIRLRGPDLDVSSPKNGYAFPASGLVSPHISMFQPPQASKLSASTTTTMTSSFLPDGNKLTNATSSSAGVRNGVFQFKSKMFADIANSSSAIDKGVVQQIDHFVNRDISATSPINTHNVAAEGIKADTRDALTVSKEPVYPMKKQQALNHQSSMDDEKNLRQIKHSEAAKSKSGHSSKLSQPEHQNASNALSSIHARHIHASCDTIDDDIHSFLQDHPAEVVGNINIDSGDDQLDVDVDDESDGDHDHGSLTNTPNQTYVSVAGKSTNVFHAKSRPPPLQISPTNVSARF
jgi:hypothetical protein